jgi:hypothetical protein
MRRATGLVAIVVGSFLLGPPALAAGPTVTTGGASSVFSDTAILGGSIDPAGLPVTSCEFEIALDPTMQVGESTHLCHEYQASGGLVGASTVLSGLEPLTKYYFVLKAGTDTGTASGQTESFSTTDQPPPAPAAQTEAASGVTGDSATLDGTVDAKDVAITDCELDYGPTTSYGQSAPCAPEPAAESGAQSESAGVSGLAPDTAYHFQIVISTEGGTARGGDQSFTTTGGSGGTGSPGGATAATAATGPASHLTATAATLNGTVDAAGQSGDTCTFYYGTGSGFQGTVPCPSAVGATGSQSQAARLSGLRPRTAYHYALVLTTSGGQLDGNTVDFTTLAEPTGTTLRATAVSGTGATLHGRVNAQGATVIACFFQYAQRSLGARAPVDRQDPSCRPRPSGTREVAVKAPLGGLRPATTYAFRVVLETQAGTVVGTSLKFTTRRVPSVRVGRSTVDIRARTARFTFRRVGRIRATRYQCALAPVRRGHIGAVHFRPCRSPIGYARLGRHTYEFLVRAGNRLGFGPVAQHRFTI